ncbi:MAG: hypothetical protein ACD_12C00578G0002 [uncultured bacterium]|uniref:Uncharacterized protein n=1 Tax=Candidatus Gottesmanbacteria bacterium GW2011_GWA2_44_17 TaxID=1618444 RepID=A0A0G1HFN5_9BACT|nr:MAG: hypothetical protein ACD_12C00578G0002 [uncultured bacterium]KKT45695.1 MAG: hypothetical protein UW37_C0042G0004 [Candidatus Gottesmanbacteria bacterium GW2011_GWA2_44_17]
MNFEGYLRSVTISANLTFAMLALAMAILIHSQIQMNKSGSKGKSK